MILEVMPKARQEGSPGQPAMVLGAAAPGAVPYGLLPIHHGLSYLSLVSQAGEPIWLEIILVRKKFKKIKKKIKKKRFDEIKCPNQLTACLLPPAAAGVGEKK